MEFLEVLRVESRNGVLHAEIVIVISGALLLLFFVCIADLLTRVVISR